MRFHFLVLLAIIVGVAGIGAIVTAVRQRSSPGYIQAQAEARVAKRARAEGRSRVDFQSLEVRIPKGKSIPPAKKLSTASKEFWEAFDRAVEGELTDRAHHLQAFHERTRSYFVESEGFGYRRMGSMPEDLMVGKWLQHRTPGKQPGMSADFPHSPGELTPVVPPDKDFLKYHADGSLQFINAVGLGFVKDRRHVSGFFSHGFDQRLREDPGQRHKVDHVLLMGLLTHETPVIYLSDELPSMKKAHYATRSLDTFESAGLHALMSGDDLYIIQKDDTLRMLGALRATKQCLTCHDAECGDLLGAFSYTIRERLTEE